MRQAKKLGFLGILLALAAIFGTMAMQPSSADAQAAAKGCSGTGPAGSAPAGTLDTCIVTVLAGGLGPQLPANPPGTAGESIVVTITSPAGATVTSCTSTTANIAASGPGVVGVAGTPANSCEYTNTSTTVTVPAGTVIGTEVISIPAGVAAGTPIVQNVARCGAGLLAFPVFSPLQCSNGFSPTPGSATTPIPAGGPGGAVGAAPPPPGTGGSNATKNCVGPGGGTVAAGQSATCQVFTNANPIPPGGSLLLVGNANTTITSCVSNIGGLTATQIGTGAANACLFVNVTNAPIASLNTPIGSETFTVNAGTATGTLLTQTASVCTNVPTTVAGCTLLPGSTALTPVIPTGPAANVAAPAAQAAASNQPTGEEKWCSPVLGTNNTGLPAQVTSSATSTTLVNQVAGPATNFTLSEFSASPTSCALVATKGGVPCNNTAATPAAGSVACSDGYFIITLSTPGSVATISCQNNLNANLSFSLGTTAGVTIPAISGGGGPCQTQTTGTTLQIPCGTTAGTAAASTTVSATCTGVLFNITSILTQCVSEPTLSGCPPPGGNALFGGGTATVTINWLATPANGGSTGGITLGTNTFTFDPPPLGTLLVTATPEAIPSNGTTATVITATFACGNGFNLTSTGFPLSATGYSNFPGLTAIAGTTTTISTVNQPILGTAPGAVCGAGLPGYFYFSSPGPVLFDNGRTSEGVNCGLSAQDNPLGVNQFGNFNNGVFGANGFSPLTNPTFPLVFTCTGAAVLAIGAGAAGDAPINVTYQSAVGGLQAVGSTLIIVSPSGVPRISIACSPSVIASGNTGSICTATVTDQNGVPLTGITGATVTWTTSDPTEATIMPCVVNIGTAPAINVTTSPNVVPQIVPQTPCSPPSGSIPGQSNTFINGQTSALLVASSYARPEVVTVSASLGVLIPPEFACLVSPYTPTGFGTLGTGAFPPVISGVGLPGLTGCGFSNPVGYTGLASALSTDSGGLTGIVTLPNTTSASTTVQIGGPAGILIAGATTTQPLGLLRGCNQLIIQTTAGTPIANIAALVSPASAVVSVWTFNNSTKQFRLAFSSDPAAPVDITTTGQTGASQQGSTTVAGTGGLAINSIPAQGTQVTEVYFVCVNQSATIISG